MSVWYADVGILSYVGSACSWICNLRHCALEVTGILVYLHIKCVFYSREKTKTSSLFSPARVVSGQMMLRTLAVCLLVTQCTGKDQFGKCQTTPLSFIGCEARGEHRSAYSRTLLPKSVESVSCPKGSKFQKYISIFCFLFHYTAKRYDVISWLAIFGSSRNHRRTLQTYLESWGDYSESETCALNTKILISKVGHIWPDMYLLSANSRAEWRHNVKWTSLSIQNDPESMCRTRILKRRS